MEFLLPKQQLGRTKLKWYEVKGFVGSARGLLAFRVSTTVAVRTFSH